MDGGQQRGGGDGRGALDVVVEGAEAVAVAVKEAEGVLAGEVLPLEKDVGPAALHGGHELLNEVVVLLPADAGMLPADVNGVVEQGLVVGAYVEQDGQAMMRGHAAERGVERHFADGDAHAAGSLVAEAEDALAIADHDAANVVVARVGEHLVDAVAVGVADEQAARLAPDLGEALASFAHSGRVDHGQQLFHVVGDERVEEGLVVILQVAHQGVFAEGRGLVVESLLAAFALVFKGADVGREQAMQAEGGAFFLGKRGALVQAGMEQEVVAGAAGADDVEVRGGIGGSGWRHGFSPLVAPRRRSKDHASPALLMLHETQITRVGVRYGDVG